MCILLLVVFRLIFCRQPLLLAQDTSTTTQPKEYWVNFGMGIGSARLGNFLFGPSFGFSVSQLENQQLLSIRFIESFELVPFSPVPSESIWDFSFLYGKRIYKKENSFITIAGGLGVVGGVRRGKFLFAEQDFVRRYYHDEDGFQTFGASVELQAFTNLFSIYGAGLYGFANINFEKSFVGFCLIVQVGKH